MAKIEQSIEINVPVHTAYNQLTQFEEYPRFMEDVEEVRQLDDTHLHWHTRAGNLDMEWDAEITQQVPDRCIAWRNTSGPKYEGRIDLRATEDDRTKVTLTMECEPKHQMLAQHGDAETAITQRTEHDLARFKKFIEKLADKHDEPRGKERTQPATDRQDALARPSSPPFDRDGDKRSGDRGQAQGPDRFFLRLPWLPSLMSWDDPFSMMRRMTEDIDHMFERFIGRPVYGSRLQASQQSGAWTPPVEVAQREDRFVVCAELAGVKREDVRVEIDSDRLTIEGDRRQEAPHAPQEYRRSERSYGHFYRVIALPPGVDTDAASASLQDGMLEITVPVAQGTRHGRQLEIRSPQ